MDRQTMVAAAVCLLAGCDTDPYNLKPSPLVVDRIEAQLEGRPCIGALERWERHYSYGRGIDLLRDRGVRRDRITFEFSEAGIYNYQSRRIISRYGSDLDERQRRIAYGEYDVPSGRLTVYTCGWNNYPDDETAG